MPEAEVSVRFVGASEGTAELIERLIVATLKARELRRELLTIITGIPDDVAEKIRALVVANAELFDICNQKAEALKSCANTDRTAAERFRWIMERDLALCKSRAAIRADLNARLGGEASGESIKSYGAGG